MANTAQAKKRAKQAEVHRLHNASIRSKMRTALKKIVRAIEVGNKEEAKDAYKTAAPYLDSMVNKRIIHKNKAARHKSRLNAQIKGIL